jgi:hypothetical protein
MRRKGQAAIELLVILAVSVIVFMVIMTSSQDSLSRTEYEVENTQIKSGLSKVLDSADFVYSQSIGASIEVFMTIPASVVDIDVTVHCLEYSITLPNGELSQPPPPCSVAKLNGSIDTSPGSKYVKLVNMGEYVSVE